MFTYSIFDDIPETLSGFIRITLQGYRPYGLYSNDGRHSLDKERHFEFMNDQNQDEKFACPCCGYKTLREKPSGTYNICEVCFWEDDPIQLDDPNYEGGANRVSLKQGQKNFQEFDACEIDMVKNVRQPNSDEGRDDNWRFID